MKNQSKVQRRETSAGGRRTAGLPSTLDPRPSTACRAGAERRRAFTLVEMLVTLVLLSLIVLALTAVFNSTQQAFRASLTQTDILEAGRNVMGLVAGDLKTMTPSYGSDSVVVKPKPTPAGLNPGQFVRYWSSPVNFYMNVISYGKDHPVFIQSMPGGSALRTNVLENFFSLSRQNVNGSPTWVGTGYAVDPFSFPTNSLYRFYMTSDVQQDDPWQLFSNFVTAAVINPNQLSTNLTDWTHLMDGVVDLTVRPYDPNGLEMTNTYEVNYNGSGRTNYIQNTYFLQLNSLYSWLPHLKGYGFLMYSNALPASVEVQLGVVENATLQHAEGLPTAAAMNYLSNHVGQVHLFRQRVPIPSVDPAAYQLLPLP